MGGLLYSATNDSMPRTVSQDEASAALKELFDACDKDGDGLLDRREQEILEFKLECSHDENFYRNVRPVTLEDLLTEYASPDSKNSCVGMPYEDFMGFCATALETATSATKRERTESEIDEEEGFDAWVADGRPEFDDEEWYGSDSSECDIDEAALDADVAKVKQQMANEGPIPTLKERTNTTTNMATSKNDLSTTSKDEMTINVTHSCGRFTLTLPQSANFSQLQEAF